MERVMKILLLSKRRVLFQRRLRLQPGVLGGLDFSLEIAVAELQLQQLGRRAVVDFGIGEAGFKRRLLLLQLLQSLLRLERGLAEMGVGGALLGGGAALLLAAGSGVRRRPIAVSSPVGGGVVLV